MKILIVGESCLDVYQYGDSRRLCPEAPVPVFNSNKTRETNGGMAWNVYNNVSAIAPEMHVDLCTNTSWESITKTRYVDYRTNYIVLRIDENEDKYGSCDVDKHDFESYDVVVISDYNKGFLTEEDIEKISLKAKTTFLDTKKILGPWCKNIDYIKINDVEYERTQHKLTEDIVERMIITTGPNGCNYQDKVFPVPKVEIKDTSGAGDTFISGLAVEYVRSNNILEAIRFANKCATRVVQKRGVSVLDEEVTKE